MLHYALVFLVIAIIGSAFYGVAWRRMRRMQLEV